MTLYSESTHCALIALRCATNQRLFNMIDDELYKAEVSMLQPGTSLLVMFKHSVPKRHFGSRWHFDGSHARQFKLRLRSNHRRAIIVIIRCKYRASYLRWNCLRHLRSSSWKAIL
ncbi:hypothetical protein BKA70DRAFT_1131121 [Coprinopsis sp. MPI-PUGE-AT-0042]|nr:hypothetical protein BKA70DRAFT_1131121 [Coprinopsis sp. MPI-PUGE-AT-0042]